MGQQQQQIVYLLTNLFSACAIVFANKAVLSGVNFRFTVALTCIHTVTTWLVACALRSLGVIQRKPLPKQTVVALAGAFVAYIVLCNVSLQLNTVGFYQLTKIAIAPTVLIMEAIAQRRAPSVGISLCVIAVCAGIGLATVSDAQVMTNFPGLVVGLVSVVVSAQYGMWIGSITKHHEITSLQLLEQYLPYASLMMTICVPLESMILGAKSAHDPTTTTQQAATLLTFNYTRVSVGLIALSAVLGVIVTFSTFLVIANTSPLTYAVSGHVKTIVIIGGGVVFFGDRIPGVKLVGLGLALGGVIAYTRAKMVVSRSPTSAHAASDKAPS